VVCLLDKTLFYRLKAQMIVLFGEQNHYFFYAFDSGSHYSSSIDNCQRERMGATQLSVKFFMECQSNILALETEYQLAFQNFSEQGIHLSNQLFCFSR